MQCNVWTIREIFRGRAKAFSSTAKGLSGGGGAEVLGRKTETDCCLMQTREGRQLAEER